MRASLWHAAWRFWNRRSTRISVPECVHLRNFWHRLRPHEDGVLLDGSRCCIGTCLDRALHRKLDRMVAVPRRTIARHRVPLGLLLLSRQHLTIEQLRMALAAQHNARRGRIGEWIESLGFADEQQITAALARQWACPVLRTNSFSAPPLAQYTQQIPLALLEKFAMLPVNFSAATSTLHIAFAEAVDHSVLYAIEQMTGCRTEACMAVPSFVRAQLEALARDGLKGDLTFERIADNAEISRIVRSYCSRTGASEIRVVACPPYLWVCLLRAGSRFLDLLVRMPANSLSPGFLSSELHPDS